ncbi:hypothetical protein C7417_1812 [Cupriavidus plantarum]|uniref:Uncharacterized protein n=2 Tax=Cupriavidus plantarum TaxID=942865 RepID=A0A316F2G8_9BURK|nr:hypothetical protein [Cupriavidus plantarum]PWK37948.1 hypothetical protein C7419_1011835 [Cupriavidus plantarum]RLK45788.1 hypothetical protein C7417_1812 [Cupriavidus plantarum]
MTKMMREVDVNRYGDHGDRPTADFRRFAMHKMPVVTFCLVAALALMTVFICVSGAFTPRETEYGSGKAVFKHYLVHYVR